MKIFKTKKAEYRFFTIVGLAGIIFGIHLIFFAPPAFDGYRKVMRVFYLVVFVIYTALYGRKYLIEIKRPGDH